MFNDLFKAYAEEELNNIKTNTTNDMSMGVNARDNIGIYARVLEDIGESTTETEEIYSEYLGKFADCILDKIKSRLH